MAKLNFSLDGKSLGEFPLDKERISIGRRPTNDIHIDNLAVSGEHAMILTLGPDSFLEDLNSTNGTMVNKKMIKKHVLQDSDVIEFGKYQLQYVVENQSKDTANDGFEKTVQIVNPANENAPSESILASTAAPVEALSPTEAGLAATVDAELVEANTLSSVASASVKVEKLESEVEVFYDKARLQVLNGNNAGQELPLNRSMVKIGTVGEQLAVITKRPRAYFVSHVGGEGRPLVNGQSIGMAAHALNDHDVIELAGIKMELLLS